MKNKLQYSFLFLFMIACLNSCEEFLDDCMICSLNTYEDNVLIQSQDEAEYCADDLVWILAQPSVDVGNTSTYWKCH